VLYFHLIHRSYTNIRNPAQKKLNNSENISSPFQRDNPRADHIDKHREQSKGFTLFNLNTRLILATNGSTSAIMIPKIQAKAMIL